jgi:hypothetical protein
MRGRGRAARLPAWLEARRLPSHRSLTGAAAVSAERGCHNRAVRDRPLPGARAPTLAVNRDSGASSRPRRAARRAAIEKRRRVRRLAGHSCGPRVARGRGPHLHLHCGRCTVTILTAWRCSAPKPEATRGGGGNVTRVGFPPPQLPRNRMILDRNSCRPRAFLQVCPDTRLWPDLAASRPCLEVADWDERIGVTRGDPPLFRVMDPLET